VPASPIGTVPRGWRTVLRLAITARPSEAIPALFDLARGLRLRAWNRLSLAAAEHHDCYPAWIATTEPSLLVSAPAPGLSIGIILLDGDDFATRQSISAAFVGNVAVYDAALPLPETNRPEWLLPIHAGDRVSHALGAVLADRLRDCDASVVFWDEDHGSASGRTEPWIKPDWDPILFAAHDGLVGACVLRADLVPTGTVQSWATLTFEIASRSDRALHLSLILTHRAVRRLPMVRTPAVVPPVAVSVIIPTRDRAELLEVCLDGLSRTDFPGDHEIIVVDNGSCEPRTKALFEHLEASGRGRVIAHPGAFNFATLANAGVAAARGDLVCLLNNDIEIDAPDWLRRMAAFATQEDVGAVGARLLYADGAIQHAGVALGIGDAAGHVDKNAVPTSGVFSPWHDENRTVSAVTAACLLVQRAKYTMVGGMDAVTFTIDFNDVDLCLRLAVRGWRTIYCADAVLIHQESRSRGTKRVGPDVARFERELTALRDRWHTTGAMDPYRSPLLRRHSERCLLAF
jgi:GT2 family glycosyltransferase